MRVNPDKLKKLVRVHLRTNEFKEIPPPYSSQRSSTCLEFATQPTGMLARKGSKPIEGGKKTHLNKDTLDVSKAYTEWTKTTYWRSKSG